MRYEIRPFPGGVWTDPETPKRKSATFIAGWADTLKLLGYEAGRLGADLVVVQLDVTDGDLRRDGMLRANARVGHPGVIASFDSQHGPLRYATDAYDFWQDNVRALALGLQALRAVDRYGISRRGEQYIGWRALPAPAGGDVPGFVSADEALRWMTSQAAAYRTDVRDWPPRELYRFLARRFHPDVGGEPADWARLDEARQLLDLTGAAS